MKSIKPNNWESYEIFALGLIYFVLILNIVIFKDDLVAVLSAFFGITYTMLAGKGNPKCYLFGLAGSGLYSWLAFSNSLWGNLGLYMLYYIPMQSIGFFKWNNHLKKGQNEIIKTKLEFKEAVIIYASAIFLCIISIIILYGIGDKSPIIDGITTIFSITGMYLTVKRCIEQWQVWIIVNGLSTIMWLNIALGGEKVYSTVIMWFVYLLFAIYFYYKWRVEIRLTDE